MGITGWESNEAADAGAGCLRSWIASRGTTGSGDAEAAVSQVRRFIEAHGQSRFQSARESADDSRIVNRAGFKRTNEDGTTGYLVLPETFRSEVCHGFDYRMVARALTDRGLLARQCSGSDLTKRVRVPGIDNPIRAFAINGSILEG